MSTQLIQEATTATQSTPVHRQITAEQQAQHGELEQHSISLNDIPLELAKHHDDSIIPSDSSTAETYSDIEESTQQKFESLINSIVNTSVEFTVDDTDKGSYIKITDKATNELLRTIPSEAMRNVLENIHDHIEELLNDNMDENRGHILDTIS